MFAKNTTKFTNGLRGDYWNSKVQIFLLLLTFFILILQGIINVGFEY